VADEDVVIEVIEHVNIDLMHANELTKPVEWAQFERERADLTNWV
jgi:hypothetical protein